MRTVTWPSPQCSRSTASAVPRTSSTNASCRSQVIAVSKVSDRTPMATKVSRRYGRAQEGVLPGAGRARLDLGLAAGDRERLLELVVEAVLEGEQQQRGGAVTREGELRLARVDDAAVGGAQPALEDVADRAGGGEVVREADGGGAALGRFLLHAHPRLGDHAERPLGAEQQAVRRRAGARSRQAARLPDTRAGRDRAHALDEVVDVRGPGREVPAGARRDPAAERRALEGLRVEAHRQALLGELLLEPRAGGARLDASGL